MNLTEGQADTDNTFASMQINGTHYISMNISLVEKTERERSLTEIGDGMRAILNEYPEIRTYNVNVSGSQGGVSGQSAVDVEIYGYDFDTTDELAQQVSDMMQALPCAPRLLSRVTNTRPSTMSISTARNSRSTASTLLRPPCICATA